MLITIKPTELNKLIPAVGTGNQFREALGSPSKILQRTLVAAIGGIAAFLVSTLFGNTFDSLSIVFILYLLWGPILEASRKNAKLKRFNHVAIFDGQIADIYTKDKIENRHEQADKRGSLEIVENRRTWLFLELSDSDGYLGRIKFPFDKKHENIRVGMKIRCLIFSNNRDFIKVDALSDAWLPQSRLWVGEYPYLLRPAFEELCLLRFSRFN